MSKPGLRQRLIAREPLLGAQLRLGSPLIAEMMAAAGFDFLIIDAEHAAQTPPGVVAQMQAVASRGGSALVRLGNCDPDLIRLYLDLGADGIIVPMVRTAEQVRLAAAACRYPPDGTRSFGPTRAMAYGFDPGYAQRANREVIFMPIIETAEAVQHIEEILAVVGLDSYIVGPVDLAMSLGVPDQFDHPRFTAAFDRVEQAAARTDIPRGRTLMNEEATAEHLQSLIAAGYSCFWVDGDEWMLASVCRRVADQFNRIRPKSGD